MNAGRINLSTTCAALDDIFLLKFTDINCHDPEVPKLRTFGLGTWSALPKFTEKCVVKICTHLAQHAWHDRPTLIGMAFSFQKKRCNHFTPPLITELCLQCDLNGPPNGL